MVVCIYIYIYMGKPYIYVMGPIWDVYIYIIIYIYVYIYIYIYVYIYIYIYIYIYMGNPYIHYGTNIGCVRLHQ